jgi:hypothetical protein
MACCRATAASSTTSWRPARDGELGISTQAGFTPRMVFGEEPEATAYLEIYDAPASRTLSVVFELAASGDGHPTASFPGSISANNGAHLVVGTLPLAAVAPGDTLVRARVRVDGKDAGVVSRTLRKAAR